jgi:hypothetical protein
MPVPQRVSFLVGWAGEPAEKKLIENGARCKFNVVLVCCLTIRDRSPGACVASGGNWKRSFVTLKKEERMRGGSILG